MFSQIEQQFLHVGTDIVRLCVWLVLLTAIFVPLERFFGASPRPKPSKLTMDIGYYFLNNLIPTLFQIPVLVLVGWVLHFLVPAQFYALMGKLPLLLRLFIGLVIGDVGYYWGHRLMHRVPFFWRFHSVHHAAEHINWLVSTRAHPIDIAFGHLCGLVPLYALGLAQPLAGRTDVLPQVFVIIGVTWGFFIHANLNWRLGYFGHLISSPGFHHWHHTKREPINRNFSSLLPWVDRLFGTYYMPERLPEEYGIDDPMPEDMAGQLFRPLSVNPVRSSYKNTNNP